MIVEDKGNRKRRELGRKAKDLKRKISGSCTACEDAARRKMKCLEDNEEVKVGFRELKEQLEIPEETGISFMQIAKQAKSSSRSSGKKIMRCALPVWRGGAHN